MNPFSEELNELFEKMASGEGSKEERMLFFQELESNPTLNKLFEQHLDFRKGLATSLKRNALRVQISDYHQQIKSNKIKVSNPISISRWAIAASISALIAVGSWFGYEWEQKQKANGEQLLARSTTKPRHSNRSIQLAEEEVVSGTAFAVNAEGFFLSTSHIIGNKTEVLLENPQDGKAYNARVVARDSRYDLVLVKIDDEAFEGLERIPYPIKPASINLAQEVFTLGFPKEDIVYGEGSVSSLNGFNGDTMKYQVSVPVNPGQSGSPLFDEQGNVIGVISAKNGSADGVSYAIKASYILNFFENSLEEPIQLPKGNQVSKLQKTKKIQKVAPFIFMVKA